MGDENGWGEGFRIKFPTPIEDKIRLAADLEGRSPQNLCKFWIIEALDYYEFRKKRSNHYNSRVLNGSENGKGNLGD